MMTQEQRKRMADLSGDSRNSAPPKYVVPLIRFDGNRGEFKKISKSESGENIEEIIKAPLDIIILKKRRILSSFSPAVSYFTNEHNNTSERLILFKNLSKTVTQEAIGFTEDLREKYQTLRTHEIIYVLFEGEICKMEIKGGSLSGYYDYQKALSSEEKHSFEVVTVLGSEKVKSEAGFGYYRITFDFRNDEIDMDSIESKMLEVSKACKAVDDYTQAKISEKQLKSAASSLTEADKSQIVEARKREQDAADRLMNEIATGKESDDINVDDIPF